MLKKGQWLIFVYALACLAPYFIPQLNQLNPHIGPLPLTVWYPLALVLAACCLFYYWSKRLWDPYDSDAGERPGEGGAQP